MRSPLRRVGAVAFAAALMLGACGDDDVDGPTATDSGSASPDSAGEHLHGQIDLTGADVIPTIGLTATADAVSGANLHVEVADLRFAPEHASGANVDGEGHAHVYVDGRKVGRMYGEWLHLGLEPGEYEIRVDLNGNDHSPFVVDGTPIEAATTVVVPESEHDHGQHDHGGFVASAPTPSVSLTVIEDAKSGYNVRAEVTEFAFAPEKASTADTTSGEGHAHLYVDGRKISRMYGEWFHFDGDLDAGDHEFRVELSANDHRSYVGADGVAIDDTVTVTVPGDADGPDHSVDDPDHHATTIDVSVVDGVVTGGGRRRVDAGAEVVVVVTSDVADEVHVHGYDVFADVGAGETIRVRFVADLPGVWEIELEGGGLLLVELEVS